MRNRQPEQIEFDCVVKVDRPHLEAVLVDIDGADYWVPRSQIHDLDYVVSTKKGVITVTVWIAKEKGLL